jgi:hypothetical protein
VGFQADKIGELVDAFLLDHGGVHVGDEEFLPPMHGWLCHDIDRRQRERGVQGIEEGAQIAVRRKLKRKIARHALGEHDRLAGDRQQNARGVDDRRDHGGSGRVRNQGRDMRHAMGSPREGSGEG